MNNNVEALKALYAALGGTPADVADALAIVDVLNAIAAKYDGDDDATLNPDAIANIAAIAGSITPSPVQPTLIEKSITANGTYTASDDGADGYSSVTANVANSYAASDENKVVSNGALVAQTSDTVTENGTVDTTLISSLLVNVPAPTLTGGDWVSLHADTSKMAYVGYYTTNPTRIVCYVAGYSQPAPSGFVELTRVINTNEPT